MREMSLQRYVNCHSLLNKVGRFLWGVVWIVFGRTTPRGLAMFRLWRVGLVRLFGGDVKWSANILPSCRIWQPWRLKMGAYACLSERVDCYNADWVIIDDQAVVSQDAFLCTASHDVSSPIMSLTTAPIHIKKAAWVCSRAVVLPGISVGKGAVVGCAAVCTKDVKAWNIVAGNPAVYIKERKLS